MTREIHHGKRCVQPAWERASALLENARAHGLTPLPLWQALGVIETEIFRRQRQCPAVYRDHMLAALARAKIAMLNDGRYVSFVEEEPIDDMFEAAAALITFWAERPEDTARRPVGYIREMRSLTACFRRHLQRLCVRDKETARIIREIEAPQATRPFRGVA